MYVCLRVSACVCVCVCVCVWNVCTEVKLPFQFHFPGYISQRGDGEDV